MATENHLTARVKLGDLEISRFIIGGNPLSGISHQTEEANREMTDWFTSERIKQTYRQAEELGVTTCIARGDRHITRLLREYWNEGGGIQWIAQTAPELGPPEVGARQCIQNGAKAVYLHGGVADNFRHHGRMEELRPAIDLIREKGLPVGIAAHESATLEYAEEHFDVDFYMCAYYCSIPRDRTPEHITQDELFEPVCRERMAATIAHLSKPAIHYKIMAAGRNEPQEAFAYAARAMRPTDAVCVGIFTKHRPHELVEDVGYLKSALAAVGQEG